MSKYDELMQEKSKLMLQSVGIDYNKYEKGNIAFDYETMMSDIGYSIKDIIEIQRETGVGNTPLIELKNLTALARQVSKSGKAARIFIKDEQCNPSGSFKDRRAAISIYEAKKRGYKGVVSATSGNYGAAVASQSAMRGLDCIIVQECYDSQKVGQPEIIEKARKCEAFGAEVVQLTVGPELFYVFLKIIKDTGYFNASLYSPLGIAGTESLGYEIAKQCLESLERYPDAVVVTHAGGGNVTGTARGLIKAGAIDSKIIGASVDLSGLHMASDSDFNKKSFTTGHTGFGIPFMTNPDRSDVPRSAARPLRYLDRYVTVNQGSVFYMTELLAQIEGLERGPAGNTSLAAAFSLAQEMENDQIIVVQETEYTGAGKHITPQLSFAKNNDIEILVNDNVLDEVPGENIILPSGPWALRYKEMDLNKYRKSLIKNLLRDSKVQELSEIDIDFLCKETRYSKENVNDILRDLEL